MSATQNPLWRLAIFVSKCQFPIRKALNPINREPSLLPLRTRPLYTSISNSEILKEHQQCSFTIAYLINSCGLSSKSAISAAQKLQLYSPERPDAVLGLLREHGFSKTQISVLVKKRPLLLLANAESILLPKFQFLLSIGVSKTDLARTLACDPTLLVRSLDNQIIPSYNFLKSVLRSDEKIVASLKRTTWILLVDHTKNLVPNLNSLSEVGVPQNGIKLLLAHYPEAVMQSNNDFCKIVREVKEMGFDPTKSTFVLAVHALSGKGNKCIREKCFEVYKSWGWSKDDIMMAFKKHPNCMILSEKKLNRSMDFLVNQMGWSSRSIAQCPAVLFFSLEKRIRPRYLVIKVLLSKGLVKELCSLTSVLCPREEIFLERFVTKYEDEVPKLMDVYRGKIDLGEL